MSDHGTVARRPRAPRAKVAPPSASTVKRPQSPPAVASPRAPPSFFLFAAGEVVAPCAAPSAFREPRLAASHLSHNESRDINWPKTVSVLGVPHHASVKWRETGLAIL